MVIGVTITVIVVLYNLIDHRHILPGFLILPGPGTIARKFTYAVITGNKELALELTDQSPECENSMLQTLENFSIYKDSEIQDVVINAYQYADEPAEGFINVLVLLTGEGDQQGFAVRLSSNYSIIGKRFSCGNDYHDLQNFK